MSNKNSRIVQIGNRIEQRIESFLEIMTLEEKIGQMSQFASTELSFEDLSNVVKKGMCGSILNEIDPEKIRRLQRIAREETRLGIPLLVGRDVIHGFHTMMPIPLGQAASWNPSVIKKGAEVAAKEASGVGINWTFAPMIDITRDPRWGRVAETLGEDPYLCSRLGEAMASGFEGKKLSEVGSIAACAKHFAGYGYSEAGKDYAYVNISENELRNIVLPPFKALAEMGVATFMAAFSDLNGIPASGSEFLMRKVLRGEWNYTGFVVSDWDSVIQLVTHGYSENGKEAAYSGVKAGIDVEMVSQTYADNLAKLVEEGRIEMSLVNESVRRILGVKFNLGLFDEPKTRNLPKNENKTFLEVAKQAALESIVMLKNKEKSLPLGMGLKKMAVIGFLADDALEQMGTWTFDGNVDWVQTPLQIIKNRIGSQTDIIFAKAMKTSREKEKGTLYQEAIDVAQEAEVVVLFMGEEAILSGEAHCRADINFPGYQHELIAEISSLNKKIILVVMAGRPLILREIEPYVDAILYAWHPGTMGGPAIFDILFGLESPSGKLPITFPKSVGQIPVYYNQRNSGRPGWSEPITLLDDIPAKAPQTSLGNVSFHLDDGIYPSYPFGFGLSYGEFKYENLKLSSNALNIGEEIKITFDLSNHGIMDAWEVTQLYIRDLFGSITRPVRELKGFKRVFVKIGETVSVSFNLSSKDLGFYGIDNKWIIELGKFNLWVGGSSNADLMGSFEIVKSEI